MLRSEKLTNSYIILISFIGWFLICFQFAKLPVIHHGSIYFILIVLLYLMEQFPIPIWKGETSLAFPLIYTIYSLYGYSMTLLTYSIIVLIVTFLRGKSIKIVLFRPAVAAISLVLTVHILHLFFHITLYPHINSSLYLTTLFFMIFLYYVLNNILIDVVILLKSPKMIWQGNWKYNGLTKLIVIAASFCYLWLMQILGNQDRGTIDVLSYFFFFSPLTAISLLGSIIARLQQERNRLKSLFSITNNLNNGLTAKDWLGSIIEQLRSLLDFEASLLIVLNSDRNGISHVYGLAKEQPDLTSEKIKELEAIETTTIFTRVKKGVSRGPLGDYFDPKIRSYAYAPLIVENELVGMWVIGRTKLGDFDSEDLQLINILANQLSIVKKSRRLIAEQANHKVIEERNRIAREIHDGIAQSLAGAILNLETSMKKYHNKPKEAYELIHDSIHKLRKSLAEVRESIYALRPNPIKHIGLVPAIKMHVDTLKMENPNLNIKFEIRGKSIKLSIMVEKVLFEIYQESIRNIIKHAKARNIDILISYQQENILLKIKDDGIGFSLLDAMIKTKQEPHFGILNMNDLADKLGASLQINTKIGQGTEINCLIPKLELEGGEDID